MPRVTISEPGKTPQPYRFPLERKRIKVGRGSDNDITIECASVSTNHCRMERVDGGYVLRDKGSTNGVKLNGTLMEVIDLFDGMEVLVGDVPLGFQLSGEELHTLAGENFSSQQQPKLPLVDAASQSSKASTSSPRATHSHRPPPIVQKSSSPLGTLLIIILLLVAIYAGMTLRHFQRTGDFLPTTMMGGSQQEKPQVQGKEKTGGQPVNKEGEGVDAGEDRPLTDSEM